MVLFTTKKFILTCTIVTITIIAMTTKLQVIIITITELVFCAYKFTIYSPNLTTLVFFFL